MALLILSNYRRWENGGVPGLQNWGGLLADPTPTVAVLTDGVTNRVVAQDDQRRNVTFQAVSHRTVLVGWLEATGTSGDIDIINQGSGFLQIDPNNRVFLGLDDTAGFTLEFPPHSNDSPEASFVVREPGGLTLLTAFAVAALRRRRAQRANDRVLAR